MFNSDSDHQPISIGGPSFLVRIYFKQNANWQGTVQWLDTNKTVTFRSALELIYLLNEGIHKFGDLGDELDFHSWEDECKKMEFDMGLKSRHGEEDLDARQKN